MTPACRIQEIRRLLGREAGFSMAELLVVCVIVGILATASIPFFLLYYQTAALKATTQGLALRVTVAMSGRVAVAPRDAL